MHHLRSVGGLRSHQPARDCASRRVFGVGKTPQAPPTHPAPDITGLRILWIDDQLRCDDASVCLLTLEAFMVDCADSGTAGLNMALSDAYSGIILDLRLPDISGLGVLESLVAAGIHTPVLLLTGFGDQETATAAMKLGATDFKSKPLFADDLIAAVKALTTLAPSPWARASESVCWAAF